MPKWESDIDTPDEDHDYTIEPLPRCSRFRCYEEPIDEFVIVYSITPFIKWTSYEKLCAEHAPEE